MVEAWQFDHLDDLEDGKTSTEALKEQCKAWLLEEYRNGGIISTEERMADQNRKKQKKEKKEREKDKKSG